MKDLGTIFSRKTRMKNTIQKKKLRSLPSKFTYSLEIPTKPKRSLRETIIRQKQRIGGLFPPKIKNSSLLGKQKYKMTVKLWF